MALNVVQIKTVKANWKIIEKKWVKDGPTFLVEFFEENPRFFPHFKELFKDKDVSEILGTPDLSSQSANVKGFISKIVDSLEDHGTLGCHCSTFANNHASRFLKSDDIQTKLDHIVRFFVRNYEADEEAWSEVVDLVMGQIRPIMDKADYRRPSQISL